jgi:Ca2+-binding RTX toxin-like protein
MISDMVKRMYLLAIFAVLVVGIGSALAASNTVPESGADEDVFAITPNDLKPSDCAALNLTSLVSGAGSITGTNANDLIVASAGDDDIRGRSGADCILAGAGMDTIRGQAGGDIILAGAGDDDLRGGPGNDVCNGGAGTDTSQGCETEISIP